MPSQLGYGETDKPDDPRQYTFRSTALDNDAIMRELGVTGKYLVGGHDWGGLLAWRLCQYCPDRVIAVAVICTPWTAPTPAKREWMPLEDLVDNFLPNFGYVVDSRIALTRAGISFRSPIATSSLCSIATSTSSSARRTPAARRTRRVARSPRA